MRLQMHIWTPSDPKEIQIVKHLWNDVLKRSQIDLRTRCHPQTGHVIVLPLAPPPPPPPSVVVGARPMVTDVVEGDIHPNDDDDDIPTADVGGWVMPCNTIRHLSHLQKLVLHKCLSIPVHEMCGLSQLTTLELHDCGETLILMTERGERFDGDRSTNVHTNIASSNNGRETAPPMMLLPSLRRIEIHGGNLSLASWTTLLCWMTTSLPMLESIKFHGIGHPLSLADVDGDDRDDCNTTQRGHPMGEGMSRGPGSSSASWFSLVLDHLLPYHISSNNYNKHTPASGPAVAFQNTLRELEFSECLTIPSINIDHCFLQQSLLPLLTSYPQLSRLRLHGIGILLSHFNWLLPMGAVLNHHREDDGVDDFCTYGRTATTLANNPSRTISQLRLLDLQRNPILMELQDSIAADPVHHRRHFYQILFSLLDAFPLLSSFGEDADGLLMKKLLGDNTQHDNDDDEIVAAIRFELHLNQSGIRMAVRQFHLNQHNHDHYRLRGCSSDRCRTMPSSSMLLLSAVLSKAIQCLQIKTDVRTRMELTFTEKHSEQKQQHDLMEPANDDEEKVYCKDYEYDLSGLYYMIRNTAPALLLI